VSGIVGAGDSYGMSPDAPALDVACGECGDWHARDDQRCPIVNGTIEAEDTQISLAATPDPDGPPCTYCGGGMAHFPECPEIGGSDPEPFTPPRPEFTEDDLAEALHHVMCDWSAHVGLTPSPAMRDEEDGPKAVFWRTHTHRYRAIAKAAFPYLTGARAIPRG
jgi:hypothetical protein